MKHHPQSRRTVIAAIIVALSVSGLILWETARQAREYALHEIRERSTNTLELVVENLRGELAKYSFLPRLLSNSTLLIRALQENSRQQDIERANDELVRVNGVSGALDSYLMNADGLTIAASNWDSAKPFVGINFSFRPYFKEAMQGRLGRFFALGTTSGQRGYYFSYPVRQAGQIIGVTVVKMDVARLEEGWKSNDVEILVLDEEGVIFLSSRPDWRLTTLKPLDRSALGRLSQSRRYADAELPPLPIVRHPESEIVKILGVDAEGAADQPGRSRKYLAVSSQMKEAGWHVTILADASGVEGRVHIALLVVGFMLASAILAGLNIYQRRRRLYERIELQDVAKAELEAKVQARTKDLRRAVDRLEAEVGERKRAENDLRRTQEELIQASKLSALGQLSAGLSHELNQPLTAIRNYAENARIFLGRKETSTADGNLGRIIELGERMARIIRNLRTYAREEPAGARPIQLGQCIRNALALLDPQIRDRRVEVDVDLGAEELSVIGGEVRLQQVFVNLFVNALDAMAESRDRRLTITAEVEKDVVSVVVSDTGSGISPEEVSRVFDPFFTTKEVGQGTGLGLSIAYGIVKQFGGRIEVGSNKLGGADFTVILQRASGSREAAE